MDHLARQKLPTTTSESHEPRAASANVKVQLHDPQKSYRRQAIGNASTLLRHASSKTKQTYINQRSAEGKRTLPSYCPRYFSAIQDIKGFQKSRLLPLKRIDVKHFTYGIFARYNWVCRRDANQPTVNPKTSTRTACKIWQNASKPGPWVKHVKHLSNYPFM